MQTNYSFIIPHKNCPDLLSRCLNSIPQRGDIQIIVVDDNSDESKKPSVYRRDVEIILLDAEHSKGAGRARNIGLKRAVGNYVLFADADDFYNSGFLIVLDKYKHSNIDVLYFSASILNGNGQQVHNTKFDYYYSNVKNGIVTDDLKYHINVPWNKMVKREFIERYGIRFEEVIQGNDILFTYQVGFLSKNSMALTNQLYCYSINNKSLSTSHWNAGKISCYIKGLYKMNAFYKFVKHNDWCIHILDNIWQQMKAHKKVSVIYLFKYFEMRWRRSSFENHYVNVVAKKREKIEKKKILFIYNEMIVGGSTTSLLSILNMMSPEEYDIDLQLQDTYGELIDLVPKYINILPLAYKKGHNYYKWRKALSPRSVYKYLKSKQYSGSGSAQIMQQDIVRFCPYNPKHYDVAVSFLERWPLYFIVKRVHANRKISWIHTDYAGAKFYIDLDRPYFEAVEKIVFVSDNCVNNFVNVAPEFKEKSLKIENILDATIVRGRSQEKLSHDEEVLMSNNKFKLVSVCRISFADKGLDRGVIAFSKLKENGLLNDVVWYIIGNGPMYKELQTLIDKYDLADYIFLLGAQSNPFKFEKYCDVYFLPSRYEGKPMAITEAQMLGLVPLITNIPSAVEILKPDRDGIICENSQDGIEQGLTKLIGCRSTSFEEYRNNVRNNEYTNIEEFEKIKEIIN